MQSYENLTSLILLKFIKNKFNQPVFLPMLIQQVSLVKLLSKLQLYV